MKIMFLLFALVSMSAFAGVEVQNVSTGLGVTNKLVCNQGVTCIKGSKGSIQIAATGLSTLQLAAVGTLTSTSCGKTFYNSAAVEVDLPEASTVLGCKITFVTLNASNFDIDPDAADIILVQTDAAGDKTRNATVGNSITLQAVSASQWAVVGILGTWADAN